MIYTDTMSVPFVTKGDIVVEKKTGNAYEVEKANPSNIKCIDAAGKRWSVPRPLLREATDTEASAFRGSRFEREVGEILRLGHVVKFKVPTKPNMQGFFVVTKVNPDGVNLVNLGGNLQGQFYRSVPERMLEKVDGEILVTNV